MATDLQFRVRFPIDDRSLTTLHARAFGYPAGEPQTWASRLHRHSLTWVGAFLGNALVGFVHACWDGGEHAFILDTVVDPRHQRRGIGRDLVHTLTEEARQAGCTWLHVDFEPQLDSFYRDACGFSSSAAGLLSLRR